jgi:signal transduction histidine kinase
MHERVSLAGGSLSIESGVRGTMIRACLPVRAGTGASTARSEPEQAAS